MIGIFADSDVGHVVLSGETTVLWNWRCWRVQEYFHLRKEYTFEAIKKEKPPGEGGERRTRPQVIAQFLSKASTNADGTGLRNILNLQQVQIRITNMVLYSYVIFFPSNRKIKTH